MCMPQIRGNGSNDKIRPRVDEGAKHALHLTDCNEMGSRDKIVATDCKLLLG